MSDHEVLFSKEYIRQAIWLLEHIPGSVQDEIPQIDDAICLLYDVKQKVEELMHALMR